MSKIEWTNETWNPTVGCTKVSPGCDNCYAMGQARRHDRPGNAYEGTTRTIGGRPQWSGQVNLLHNRLTQPLRWKKPRRIFVDSMSDLFHEGVPDEFIDQVFAVMAIADEHIFQVLTKRPERMRQYLADRTTDDEPIRIALTAHHAPAGKWCQALPVWPLPNVWLGTSVENQETAGERIPLLLQTPAAIRWISAEPLLEPINLHGLQTLEDDLPTALSALARGRIYPERLDWVVVGGESGPRARPFDIQWARDIIEQCRAAGVPVFMKQLGRYPGFPANVNAMDRMPRPNCQGPMDLDEKAGWYYWVLKDRKGGDPAEWPADLRVREYPA